MKFRTFLLGLSALMIAGAAAFFSVTGLSKLFAGASLAVMFMAGSLEFGKLIAASFLHTYWNQINKILRTYLVIGVVTLILITSMGIYGFLTSAYQTTADELSIIEKEVSVIELKKERYEEQLNSSIDERNALSNSITELTKGLSNNVIQYTDSTGRLITTTSSSTRRVLNDQLDDVKTQRDLLSQRIEALTDSVTSLDIEILEIEGSSDLAAEIGPLKYMSEITGLPMANVVNIFALMIIFVFDPFAVTLVIAFNTALKVDKGERDKKQILKKRKLYGEYPDKSEDDNRKESELWDNTLQDGLDDVPYEDNQFETDVDDIKDNQPPIKLTSNDIETIIKETEKDSEPNETLKQAAENYKKVINPLDSLKKDTSRRGVDIDGDGTIDGYDNNGDGLIDEPVPASSKRAQYVMNARPFYARPDFNWGDTSKWINNQNAVNYYLTYIKNQKDKSKYPTDFDSKTY